MLMGRVCPGAGILIRMRLTQGLGLLLRKIRCTVLFETVSPPRAMIRKLMALRTLIVDDFGIAGVIVGTMRSRQLVLP
jgi:hypothetical protein